MAQAHLTDGFLGIVEPLLPPSPPRRFRNPGRKPIGPRLCLTRILFVLETGIQWEEPTLGMGFGSGITCWRRLRARQEAGQFHLRHTLLRPPAVATDNVARRVENETT
jgi:transposase